MPERTQALQGLGVGETQQVEVGHLQMGTVRPLCMRQAVILKTAEMFFVVHFAELVPGRTCVVILLEPGDLIFRNGHEPHEDGLQFTKTIGVILPARASAVVHHEIATIPADACLKSEL